MHWDDGRPVVATSRAKPEPTQRQHDSHQVLCAEPAWAQNIPQAAATATHRKELSGINHRSIYNGEFHISGKDYFRLLHIIVSWHR